ncbi:MAG: hypothetical protein Q4P05_07610 [Actinomycetaceae bacterium]|nr:hypothetical protein [Actinomycetaceae bacterium]
MKPQVIDLRGFGEIRDLRSRNTPVTQVSRFLAVLHLPLQSSARNRLLQLVRTKVTLQNSGPESYASLDSACLIYGIPIYDPSPNISLVVRTKHTRRPTIIGAHLKHLPVSRVTRHSRTLPDEAFTEIDNKPVLTPEYLILELLAQKSLEHAIVNADAAFAHFCHASNFHRKRTIDWFHRLLSRLRKILKSGRYRRCKRRILRRLHYVSPWSQSPAETLFRLAMMRAGLPNPFQQYPFQTQHSAGFVDFAWPTIGIGFEMDGKMKYTSHEVVIAERVREQKARRFLPNFFRWMWDDLSDPSLTDRLRALFPRRVLSPPRRVW